MLARDFAGAGSAITLAGTLGYIDAKYKNFIGPRGIDVANVRAFQNTPDWTVSEHARRRSADRRRLGQRLDDRVVPQPDPSVRDCEPVPRPAGLCAVGREPDLDLRRGQLFNRRARQEPDRRALQIRGLSIYQRQSGHRRPDPDSRRAPISPTLGKEGVADRLLRQPAPGVRHDHREVLSWASARTLDKGGRDRALHRGRPVLSYRTTQESCR